MGLSMSNYSAPTDSGAAKIAPRAADIYWSHSATDSCVTVAGTVTVVVLGSVMADDKKNGRKRWQK